MRRLIRPITIQGKIRLFSLMLYLVTANVVFTQNKPPTAVSRTLQTQNFAADTKKTLKASINALQDLDYTIDVLNSDVGLITASKKQGTTTTRTNLEEDPFEAFFRALTGIEDNSDVIISPLTLSATITVKEISTDPFLLHQ